MPIKTRRIVATQLTDTERIALSYAFFDMQFDVQAYRDMAGVTRNGIQVISGWDRVTPGYEEARIAGIREAMFSLERFKLVEGYYQHKIAPTKERVVRTDEDGLIWVSESGWRYRINDAGREMLQSYNARIYRCCDGCVVLPCVCREKTYCAEHGGGCHGTHD